ncbi:alpha/beta fold hydrolase [Holzapfeliella sp. JNUCC 72]
MKQLTFLSADEQTGVHLVYWLPNRKPRATIQIVHGMAEYVERYQDFAQYLTQLGYAVIGHDHLGHGQSVDEVNPNYGYFAAHQSSQVVIEDINQVTDWVADYFEDIPHIILGHSMGSFAVRQYLQNQENNSDIAGVILMGTGKRPAALPLARGLSSILNQLAPKKVNPLLNRIVFGSYSRHFEEPGNFNWLSQNQANVNAYEKDKLMGFTFTNNGFYTLFKLIAQATKVHWANHLDPKVAYLVISGSDDPVGDYGKGPKKVYQELKSAGLPDVQLELIPGLRHELLFENEKKTIYEVIESWIQKNILQK